MQTLSILGSEKAVRRQFELDFYNLNAGKNGHPKSIMQNIKLANATYVCTPILEDAAVLQEENIHSEYGRKFTAYVLNSKSQSHLKHNMAYIHKTR